MTGLPERNARDSEGVGFVGPRHDATNRSDLRNPQAVRALKILVQCFLNQTAPNWKLVVYHDGPDGDFDVLMTEFERAAPDKIQHYSTAAWHNDWGHSLRDRGLKRVTGDYVLLTNGDNYYVPRFVEVVTQAIAQSNADVIIFDMVHSHDSPGGHRAPPYSVFFTEFAAYKLDVGAAVVRASLAKTAGFRDKSADGDQTYFADIGRNAEGAVCKINSVLFVHN